MSTSKIADSPTFETVRKSLKKFRDKDFVDVFSPAMEPLEKVIYKDGLRIKAVHFHEDLDLMLIVLNNKKTLKRAISDFKSLRKAKSKELLKYELSGGGTGIHWPDLDEDISLKGLLQDEITQSIRATLAA